MPSRKVGRGMLLQHITLPPKKSWLGHNPPEGERNFAAVIKTKSKKQKPQKPTKVQLKAIRQTRIKNLRSKQCQEN